MKEWNEFDRFSETIERYMPMRGEGETLASQTATAVNKLVYKWFNDGDVFDNSYSLGGWCNDLSSYANWLYKNVPSTQRTLDKICLCTAEGDYEDLLYELCEIALDDESIAGIENDKKVGSIYECDGPFKYSYWEDEDEDEEYAIYDDYEMGEI